MIKGPSFIVTGIISAVIVLFAVSAMLFALPDNGGAEAGFVPIEGAGLDPDINDGESSHEPAAADSISSSSSGILHYKKGDWNRFVFEPESLILPGEKTGPEGTRLFRDDRVDIISYGAVNVGLTYGDSIFTDDKYKQFDTDEPVSRLIPKGVIPHQIIQVHIEGQIGPRLTIYLDHDSEREENTYRLRYRALSDDELVQEINAGEIEINFNHTKYTVFDNSTSQAMGVDMTLKRKNLTVKGFGSVLQGETEVEYFRGDSSQGGVNLKEYQYVQRSYYQLEPFKRYDNLDAHPGDPALTKTMTSDAAVYGTAVYPVSIEPSGFELYMDDQAGSNEYKLVHVVATDGTDYGYYDRLVNGQHYTINHTTGVVTLLFQPSTQSRIFAVYSRSGSSDPHAIASGTPEHPEGRFAGKYMVFIKYGASLPASGRLDAYEIRSVYRLGDRDIRPENFRLSFFREGNSLPRTDIDRLGPYQVNYAEGTISFNLREPFRQIVGASADQIYRETPPISVHELSRYSMRADYMKNMRSFKLRHGNIVRDSVRVKIDNAVISSNLYTVDTLGGFIIFYDPNNPLITSRTDIEVKYQYLPIGVEHQAFLGGVRAEYAVTREITLGGTVLFADYLGTEVIPEIGREPTRNVLVEGDVRLEMDDRRMSNLFQKITKNESLDVPIEIGLYAEYDRNFKETNTFGKGLMENFETGGETMALSLSEKDWILSSLCIDGDPNKQSNHLQDRGRLNYYFYRDPDNPSELQTRGYGAKLVPFAQKSAPFNVAHGHLPDAVQTQSQQMSLAFDYDFNQSFDGSVNPDTISVVTRGMENHPIDLSTLQYIEVTYRMEGGGAVDLEFDVGRIDEDSDGDGILDTEDTNGNRVLDPGEDKGYDFAGLTKVGSGPNLSSMTRGDGVLNNEDLNGNGVLDSIEDIDKFSAAGQLNSSSWKTIRIHTGDRNLSHRTAVESVRLTLKKASGNTGRIYFSSIRFVSSSWRVMSRVGTAFDISVVNNLNDPEYGAYSFFRSQSDIYKQLYGSKTSDEINAESESALQIDYTGGGGTVTRRFMRPLDLRFYKTMHLWLYPKTPIDPSDTVTVKIGSSETDYISYVIPMPTADKWNEITMKLDRSSSGDYEGTRSGNVDLKRIQYIELSIVGNDGSIWVNDIYASEPESIEGDAHWIEAEVRVTKPLFTTDSGIPVMSNLSLKYIKRGYSTHFDSISRKSDELAEDRHDVLTSFDLLPSWGKTFQFSEVRSTTESLNEQVAGDLRGDVIKRSFYTESAYRSTFNGVPSVTMSYRNDTATQEKNEYFGTSSSSRVANSVSHAPMLLINERVTDPVLGTLTARTLLTLLFHELNEARRGDESFRFAEQRQKNNADVVIEYRNTYMFIKPVFTVHTEEIVSLSGMGETAHTEIDSEVAGAYHVPFTNNEDMKYVVRTMSSGFSVGMTEFWYIAPQYDISFSYRENNFRDYDFGTPDFSRLKNAASSASSRVTLPILLGKIPLLDFIRSFVFGYNRSLFLNESDVPFEGEAIAPFDEKYGIARTLDGLLGPGLNYFQYYPGFFFAGRDNFGNGRDFAHKHLDTLPRDDSGNALSDYNNALKLIDSFNLNWNMDFDQVVFISSFAFSQIAERMNVSGIPGQIVSFTLDTTLNFDLMKMINRGFFSEEKRIENNHSFSIDVGYSYALNMRITSNIEEQSHTPRAGFTIKWGRSFAGFRTGVSVRHAQTHEYIPTNAGARASADDIYMANLTGNADFYRLDFGLTLEAIYETDVKWLYELFSKAYELVAPPIFSISYFGALNRYDYTVTVSPEPYDSHLIALNLSLDIHQHVRGGLTGRLALEQYRHRETSEVTREIFSWEIGFNFSLIF